MEILILYLGFILAAYAVIGNDVIQTLGTFLTSNKKTHWTILIQNSSDMNGLFHHNLDENIPKFNGEAFIDLNISTENYQVEIPSFTNLGSIAYP